MLRGVTGGRCGGGTGKVLGPIARGGASKEGVLLYQCSEDNERARAMTNDPMLSRARVDRGAELLSRGISRESYRGRGPPVHQALAGWDIYVYQYLRDISLHIGNVAGSAQRGSNSKAQKRPNRQPTKMYVYHVCIALSLHVWSVGSNCLRAVCVSCSKPQLKLRGRVVAPHNQSPPPLPPPPLPSGFTPVTPPGE